MRGAESGCKVPGTELNRTWSRDPFPHHYELDGRHDLPDKIELAVDIKVIISTLTNEIVWVTVPDY